MKTKTFNLIITLTLISGICFGQNQTSIELNINDLIGTWKYTSKWNDENFVLFKMSEIKKDYVGQIMKFKSDGKMLTIKRFYRKCGNDRSHIPKAGNWNFDKNNNILKTTIGKSDSVEYQILELTSKKIIMKKIITE